MCHAYYVAAIYGNSDLIFLQRIASFFSSFVVHTSCKLTPRICARFVIGFLCTLLIAIEIIPAREQPLLGVPVFCAAKAVPAPGLVDKRRSSIACEGR